MHDLALSFTAEGEITMTSLEIAERTGKDHFHVLRDIRVMLKELEISESKFGFSTISGIREIKSFNLPKKEVLCLISGYSIKLRMKIIERLEELEKARPQPTTMQLLENAIVEMKRLAATKAEIGTRREATAMNTASQATKKVNKLEIELDKSKEYCSIKRMTMLNHGQNFNWRLLKNCATEMGINTIDIFDANYGTVKAYHKQVWLEAYDLTF